jgi:LysR family nitrogen assimilation transcriptional regulator
MDEGQLRAFLTIVECQSITKAADELGLAQPSLSQQLLRLEDELGAKLFQRTSRGVSTTTAGQLFKEHAERILQNTRQAREEIRRSTKAWVGEVSLGIPLSLGGLIGHRLIVAARVEFPDMKLRLRQGLASDLVKLVEDGTLDTALLYYADDLWHLSGEHVADETLFLVGPTGAFGEVDANGIALQPVSVEILRRVDLLMLPIGKGLKRRINQQPHGEAIRLSIRAEIDALPLIKSLLASGAGYSLLPHIGVRDELRAGTLAAARIDDIDLTRSLSLVRTAARPPSEAAMGLERIVKRILEDVREEGLWVVA